MLIDETKLLGHFDNDKELIGELLEVFEASYGETLNSLKSALSESDFKNVELHAHTIKGMVSNFFAESIKEAAYYLETAGKNQDISGHKDKVAQIEKELPVLVEEVKALCNG